MIMIFLVEWWAYSGRISHATTCEALRIGTHMPTKGSGVTDSMPWSMPSLVVECHDLRLIARHFFSLPQWRPPESLGVLLWRLGNPSTFDLFRNSSIHFI